MTYTYDEHLKQLEERILKLEHHLFGDEEAEKQTENTVTPPKDEHEPVQG